MSKDAQGLRKERPTIGLTAGDLAGIGPEILAATLKELQNDPFPLQGCQLKVIGDHLPLDPGRPSTAASKAALASLEAAALAACHGDIEAVVTGPVSKYQLHQVGFPYPGQTEFFAARADTSNYAMLLIGGKLTVALVTAHLPLREAIQSLTTSEIIRVGELFIQFLQRRHHNKSSEESSSLDHARPLCIALPGLNPHAGEQGDLGAEEEEIITPALKELQNRYPDIHFIGPASPDTIFWEAVHARPTSSQKNQGEKANQAATSIDGILCMYHDQGLIPLKLHAFDQGVNTTLGLPFVRTSPDHGTAYAIAGQGKANHRSYLEAVKLAAQLIKGEYPFKRVG